MSIKVLFPGIIFLSCISGQSVSADEQFGRFFTTPSQREHLDELRKIKPGDRVQIDEQTLLIEEEVEEVEEVPVDALTVRGLVFRGEGKSTAWINNSNTFEGGLSSQYINIGNIESDQVEIKIPTSDTSVKLNVGQTFDPISESYKDLSGESTSTAVPPPAVEQ